MKVLHVLASNRYSGAENVACKIIELFSDSDIEMVYASVDGPISDVLEQRNIRFLPMHSLTVGEVNRVIAEFQPDVIHAHDIRAGLISTFSKIDAIISHLHKNDPRMKTVSLTSVLYAISCCRFSSILTVSPSVEKEFLFNSLFRKKITCVGNPLDIQAIRSGVKSGHAERYDIGLVGRLCNPKNPMLFLDIVENIYKDFPDLRVCIVGDGVLREEMEERVSKSGLEKCIEFLGFVSEPYTVMKNTSVICMPSKYEGFGLVAAEALALGVPVICSSVGGLSTIVDDRCGKICNNMQQYVEEAKKLISDHAYYVMKQKNAFMRADKLDNVKEYRRILEEQYRLAAKG